MKKQVCVRIEENLIKEMDKKIKEFRYSDIVPIIVSKSDIIRIALYKYLNPKLKWSEFLLPNNNKGKK